MKKTYLLLFILACFISANAQKNYPILTLEEIGAATMLSDEETMVVVENVGEVPNLAFYDLEKRELSQKCEAKLPENPIQFIVPNEDGLLYLVTIKKGEEGGVPMFDAIYSFDIKSDKIKKIYSEEGVVPSPSNVSAVKSKLVFSGRIFHEQPQLFNLKTKAFEVFSDDESLRVLCTSDIHDSYVIVKFTELEEDDSLPVYVMNHKNKLSSKVAVFSEDMVISTTEGENRLPGFDIINPDYYWISQAYDNGQFPLAGFFIASRPGIVEKYNKLANKFDIQEISAANENFMAARGKGQFWVYNTKTLNTTKPKTVSDEDMAAINTFLKERTEYIKNSIQSAGLEKIFDAKFYSITGKTDLGDNSYTESSFVIFAQNDKYNVLLEEAELKNLVASGFKLEGESSAASFQDALNALYPPGTFDTKHIQFYKKNDNWYFIRGESFGQKKGVVVSVDALGKIEKIEKQSEIN